MPASTVQVLGAEKALFRSLRTGARPPKHGIIFQWEEIHGAQYWLKGKIARALAGKLSIASRIDLYSGEYMGDNLLQDVKKRIEDIKSKYPTAPKRVKPEQGREQREGSEKRRPYRERPHGEKRSGDRPAGEKSKKFKKKWKKEKRNRPNK
jgi:nucleolar protein 56